VQHDEVIPLAPETVEAIRRAMLSPRPREVAASSRRSSYSLPAPGDPQTRQRDALIVSMLAYGGVRPGELRALRWSDVHEGAIHVQRGTNPNGTPKPTKGGERRQVRLLPALAADLREYRLAAGRPPEDSLVLGSSWTKTDWQCWRVDRWAPACRAVGLDPIPRPYDLRHSFASLLLASGQQPVYVARQLGHSFGVLLRTYAHLLDNEGRRLDADGEIETARSLLVRISQAA
jgi:integrase